MNAYFATFALSMALVSDVFAASVFKCVDASGKVTFTQYNCPDASTPSGKVDVRNQRISGAGETVKLAEPKAYVPPVRPSVVYVEREAEPVQTSEPDQEEGSYRGPRKTGRVIQKPADPPIRVQMQSVPYKQRVTGRDGKTRVKTRYYKVPVLKQGR